MFKTYAAQRTRTSMAWRTFWLLPLEFDTESNCASYVSDGHDHLFLVNMSMVVEAQTVEARSSLSPLN
jgi:hypothetical protein